MLYYTAFKLCFGVSHLEGPGESCGTVLAYADYVNLLGDNIDTVNKNTETVTNSSIKVALEMNVETTKYMLLSCHQGGT
jgi:hypothetical protein